MTTALLTAPARSLLYVMDGLATSFGKQYAGSKGGTVFTDIPVFRTGTFRDSSGMQSTWEQFHLDQMMSNNSFLASKNILPAAPVRDGHKTWLVGNVQGRGNVVGWTQSMKTQQMQSPVDGQEYSYLLADVEITEPYAQQALANGTWRNRSSEIIQYTTNNETELWPVFGGYAYVDMPAVEGLNFGLHQAGGGVALGTRVIFDLGASIREINVQPTQQAAGVQQGQPALLALPVLPQAAPPVAPTMQLGPQFPQFGQPQTQPQQQANPFAQQQSTPQPFAQPSAPQQLVFMCNGQQVTDPGQVQGYINAFEASIKELRDTNRKEFVKGLVIANKILAPQQPEYEAFALALDDAQYAAWTQQFGLPNPLLANHGGGVTNPANGAQPNPQSTELETARQIVRIHERSGQIPTMYCNTPSYQKLVAAGERPALKV